MAMRSGVCRFSIVARYRSMESTRGAIRYLSDDRGKILSEEERAKETVYIQKDKPSGRIGMKMKEIDEKMEKEKMEKMKKKAEKEKAEKEKEKEK